MPRKLRSRWASPSPGLNAQSLSVGLQNWWPRMQRPTSRIDAGQVRSEIMRISADCWFRLPQEFTMIAKAMLNLDRSVLTLDPGI